ncbi:MAG: exonuclease SbcCD subunit D [Nitriliruptorales bacterium]|nr:exonuclease SbcCD subunit D [Nitriliruptorales bacterium]
MRILHTSDWHVGRSIRGRSRADEHRAVLAEIVEIARTRQVDLVLVAGDLFDTATPSPQAERIVYGALLALAETGAHVVVIAGNHDNARRLAAVEPLLGLTRIHAGAHLRRPEDGGVLDLELAGEQARIALVPFLSQRSIVKADQLMERDAAEHTGRYQERCKRIINGLTEGFGSDAVNIVLAHLTVTSGKPVLGGGERAAHTIFDYFVPPQAFPSTAHYVALGHLHRPHKIPGACPIWYPGSPLHLDFGEAAGEKAVLLVDVSPGTPAEVEQVPLTAGRRLATLRGTLAELEARRDDVGDEYLRIVVEEPSRVGLADEVRDLFPHAVDVTVARPDDEREEQVVDLDDLSRSPQELFAEYLDHRDIDDDAIEALFGELLEDVTTVSDT